MTNTNHGTGNDPVPAEIDADWAAFEVALAGYLATMTDPDEGDHLLVEVTDPDPDGEAGCPPYAQFAGCGDGAMIRAEISGNAYLRPQFRLGYDAAAWLTRMGWSGGAVTAADGVDALEEPNWYVVAPLDRIEEVARVVVAAMRDRFGIVHPQLLTYQAWGPAADEAEFLGLCATGEVPFDEPQGVGRQPILGQLALQPSNRDELVGFVCAVLREKYEADPTVDDDGDFVLHHLGQPVWVCVRTDQPAVEIMARVAHDVHSRRATAVEIGLLNRDNLWVRWTLRERTVWQTLLLPGSPFVPTHLYEMLDLYIAAMSETRDDLAYRTGAKVA
jgi:hypothetical protein